MKKVINLDLSNTKHKKSPTLGELEALNRKPITELTPAEKKLRDKSNLELKNALGNLSRSISLPPIADNQIDFPPIEVIPKPNLAEQKKQTRLLEKLAEQNSDRNSNIHNAIQPRYDSIKNILYFSNTPIEITKESQQIFCKRLFRGGMPVKRPVDKMNLDKVLKIEELSQEKRRKKIYAIKDALNTLIYKHTHIDDLFVIVKGRVWFNDKYL